MKVARNIILWFPFLAITIGGCSKPAEKFDGIWTPPVSVASSLGGLGGAVPLQKFLGRLIGVQSLGKGSATLLILDRSFNSWQTCHSDLPDSYAWGYAAIDRDNVLLPQGYAENEHFVMKALIGTLTEKGNIRDAAERTWGADKKLLLGETGPNVKMNATAKRRGAGLGQCILSGTEMYIPFSFDAETLFGINNSSNGPFANGVFRSSDSGKSWRLEKISTHMAIGPAMCRTDEHVYYFAGINPLWSSRKATVNGSWEDLKTISKTFAMVDGGYAIAGAGDTAHICWMDRRHNKWRFNFDGPPIENNEIYYRRRKDSDSDWSKEVCLSKGLLYSYAPSISAESNNVVVVWAGIRTAGKQHTDMGPNDIYYVTSKDGGERWTEPLKITDGAKDGMTAGMPQVALLNGTIHLLYIQGKLAKRSESSPGLTKLGLEPWPIYYTQRPFPN